MRFFNKLKNTIKSDNDSLKEDDSYEINDKQPNEKRRQKQIFDSTLHSNVDSNFKYLDDLLHSNKTEIILESDIILQENESSKYLYGISIEDKNIIVDGNNHFVDARSKACIFNIHNCEITFKNITFKNSFYEKKINAPNVNYGAIHSDNAIICFENCKFLNNQSNSDNASTIYNTKGRLTFKKCKFIGNNNNTLENIGGSLTLKDCEFSENEGNAIYNQTDLKSKIENSNFKNNQGRAIKNVLGPILILKSNFKENLLCDGENGIIYNDNQFSDKRHDLRLIECIFENNIVKYPEDNFRSLGGAIYNKSILFCDTCIFNENYAFAGSAICNENSYINIVNSNFSNNRSKYGAVIYQYHEDGNLTVEKCEFCESIPDEHIIYIEHGSCLVKKSTFETNNINAKGYAIYNNNATITIEKSKFKDENNNKTIFNSNILKISEEDNLEDKIKSSENAKPLKYLKVGIDENSKGFNYLDELIQKGLNEILLEHDIIMQDAEQNFFEGGIEISRDNLTVDGQGHIIDANKLSRIFYITAKNVTLKNIKFINGKYVKSMLDGKNNGGGAIYSLHDTSLTIKDCEFIENLSRESAGAICSKGDLILIERTKFIKNHCRSYGTIYNDLGSVNLVDCEFSENNSGNGGVAYINKGDLKSENCNFNNNSAVVQGGVINAENGCLEFQGCSFNNNTSNQGFGGGAISNGNATINLINCTFENNYGYYGGAINNRGVMNIMQCGFGENYAITKTSEKVYKSQDKYLSLIDSYGRNFEDSIYKSLGEGGGINNNGIVKLFDSTFNGKEGDILFNEGQIEIGGCAFKSYHSIKNKGKMIEGKKNIIK